MAAANALITLAEFREWLNTTDTGQDTLNQHAIDAASQDIEDETGRKLITPSSAITEIFDGDGANYYYTKQAPIITVSALAYRTGSSGSTWQSVLTDWSYETDLDGGKIFFVDGNVFGPGLPYNWKIGYTYGYAIANVPQSYKRICCELAARYKKLWEGDLHGTESKNFGDQSTNYSFGRMPEDIRRALDRLKRRVIR